MKAKTFLSLAGLAPTTPDFEPGGDTSLPTVTPLYFTTHYFFNNIFTFPSLKTWATGKSKAEHTWNRTKNIDLKDRSYTI